MALQIRRRQTEDGIEYYVYMLGKSDILNEFANFLWSKEIYLEKLNQDFPRIMFFLSPEDDKKMISKYGDIIIFYESLTKQMML